MFFCPHRSQLSVIFFKMVISSAHVKISQLVASLQTSRQQVVFARLVTSCQQVWNKLLTTCNNLVDIVRLVTRLFQQGCFNHDIQPRISEGVHRRLSTREGISWKHTRLYHD